MYITRSPLSGTSDTSERMTDRDITQEIDLNPIKAGPQPEIMGLFGHPQPSISGVSDVLVGGGPTLWGNFFIWDGNIMTHPFGR